MQFKGNEVKYIIWQNRATRFYLAARLLALNEIWGPSAFCAHQALELLLKATLIYWDGSFDPIKAGHNFNKMMKTMKNKVPKSADIYIPPYFYENGIYQEITRYPNEKKGGEPIPSSFLNDLDESFYSLISLVPFQFNSELKVILDRRDHELVVLRKKNEVIRELGKFLSG